MSNPEYIDRIIIAAENEIKGKKEVRVELVETLLRVLRDLNNTKVIEHLDSHGEMQEMLNYD